MQANEIKMRYKIEKNSKKLLTPWESYLAMYYYLDAYYKRSSDSGVGGLLGGMSLFADGLPADYAAWEEWLEAIQEAKEKKEEGARLRFQNGDPIPLWGLFKTKSPAAKIAGSYAVHEKIVSAKGIRVSYIKYTYDANGVLLHAKDKLIKQAYEKAKNPTS